MRALIFALVAALSSGISIHHSEAPENGREYAKTPSDLNKFCARPLDPEAQPTQEEMEIAAAFVGLEHIPPVVAAIPQDCMGYAGMAVLIFGQPFEIQKLPYLGVTFMHGYDIVLMWDGWRRTEGLTILVHEFRHVRQMELQVVGGECDATYYGTLWASMYGEHDGFLREMGYGMPSCVGGQQFDPIDGEHDDAYDDARVWQEPAWDFAIWSAPQ